MGQNKGINLENLKDFKKNTDRVITEALSDKLNVTDIADWAKSDTKPEYTSDEVGADSKGSAQNALQGAKDYITEQIALLINGAPDTLDTLKEIADAMLDNEDVVKALQSAIGNKANSSDLTAHINNKSNPHNVSKTDVGLGNVENKSSATIRSELTKEDVTTALGYTPPTTNTTYSTVTTSVNGLMSSTDKGKLDGIASGANAYSLPTATSSVLGGVKTGTNITNSSGTISITKDNVTSALGYTPPTTNTTYSAATQSAAGLMSADDKKKLDGIASGANAYTHPTHTAQSSGLYKITVDSQGHVSGVTTVTKSDITGLGIPAQDTNTTYSDFVKSGSGAKSGLVPAPSTTAGTTKYLREDGTWQTPPNTTYSVATTNTNGLLSATDKSKLDSLSSTDVNIEGLLQYNGKNYLPIATFRITGVGSALYNKPVECVCPHFSTDATDFYNIKVNYSYYCNNATKNRFLQYVGGYYSGTLVPNIGKHTVDIKDGKVVITFTPIGGINENNNSYQVDYYIEAFQMIY